MSIELTEGANELVFRIGDDRATEIRLGLTYAPASTTSAPAVTPKPTLVAVATPTAELTPTPTPAPVFLVFDDGTWRIGTEIKPGTYRLREPASFCYWARLKGFDGTLSEILANANVVDAYSIVTIPATDKGFESDGCGEWSSDLSRVTASKTHLDVDGTYIVGTDLAAGTWKSSGGDACYWARLSGFAGSLNQIIANNNVFGKSTLVTIRSTDKGFETSGCGTWARQ